jgi:hypothetical protein
MAGRLRYRLFEPPGAQTSVPRLWVSLRAPALVGPVGDGAGRCGRCNRRRRGAAARLGFSQPPSPVFILNRWLTY